jgi:hypothetical protein
MYKLSFAEIKDGRHFEALVAAYFRSLAAKPGSNIKSVKVVPAGIGPDGGVDIKVDIETDDGVQIITRTYIIQCKFHKSNINPDSLGRSSLEGLITSNGGDAYLVICRKMPTAKLTEYFAGLNLYCRHKYSYLVWSGEEFLEKLYAAPDSVIKQYFPRYYARVRRKK